MNLIKLTALCAAIILAAACGDPDPVDQDTPDTTNNTNNHTGGTTNNTTAPGTTNNTTTPGTTNNTTTPIELECDDAAMAQIARGVFGVNRDVSAGDFTVIEEEGAKVATIDAAAGGPAEAANRSFLYVNLATGEQVMASDAEAFNKMDWHIAFKRTEIRINGGNSGPGVFMLARVEAEWDAAMPPSPMGGTWLQDTFVDDETCELLTVGRDTPATAFGVWYNYDMTTHAVTVPEGAVYFLYDAVTHAAYKLEIQAYTSGAYTVRWAPVGRQ